MGCGVTTHSIERGQVRRQVTVTRQAWSQRGVSPSRIAANGHGSSNPRFANPVTDEEHQANRRVEVTIYG